MTLFPANRIITATLATGAVLALAGCGTSMASNGTAQNQPAEAQQGTEGQPVPYTDARYHYRIDAPGRVTSGADGTASFIGASERIEIAVVQGAQAADPTALAAQDTKTLSASAQGFHELAAPSTLTLGGRHVTKFIFTWSPGTSAVTGKVVELTSVRYYVPKDATTVAVITYGIVSNQYDPQGADDIVSTFQWQ
jgi:hypothetical protein